MKFKGNIYITDPSYIALKEDWADDEGFDLMDETIHCPEFTDCILKSTGIGDCVWKVYECESQNLSEIKTIIVEGDYNHYMVVGELCVDSATACVVYQKEVDKYNPSFIAEFKDKPLSWTLIENFEGEIESFYDSEGELHFIGIGNLCFFSA